MRHKIEIVNNEPVHIPIEETEEEILEPEAEPSFNEVREFLAGESVEPDILLTELTELRAKKDDAEKRFLYLQAEFQNYRRRITDEKAALDKFAGEKIIKEMLPIVDNFERGLAAAKATSNFESLIGGVAGVMKQMEALLQKSGVTPIESVGKEFDPKLHEAIGVADESDLPANTVVEELQRGYRMHERVLRPSLVKVSQG